MNNFLFYDEDDTSDDISVRSDDNYYVYDDQYAYMMEMEMEMNTDAFM